MTWRLGRRSPALGRLVMSRIFRRIETLEFTVVPSGDDEEPLELRLDVLRVAQTNTYRARLWQIECFRIQSTFPQNQDTGSPLDQPSDEDILVGRSDFLSEDLSAYEASSDEEAIETAMQSIRRFLESHSRPGGFSIA